MAVKYRRNLYVFCFSILPLMVCSGMVYSILSLYLSELGASKTEIGLIYMTGSAMGALISPTIGKLSDRIGRKPVMAASMAGFIAAFLAYSMVDRVAYVFPIQALEGATWAAMGTVALAFIADMIPVEQRGWAMGVYERMWFIGWIVGPFFGGYLADNLGFRTTLLIGSALTVVGLILLLTKVKEVRRIRESYISEPVPLSASAAHSSQSQLPPTSVSASDHCPQASQ
jgi:MFS family permease